MNVRQIFTYDWRHLLLVIECIIRLFLGWFETKNTFRLQIGWLNKFCILQRSMMHKKYITHIGEKNKQH